MQLLTSETLPEDHGRFSLWRLKNNTDGFFRKPQALGRGWGGGGGVPVTLSDSSGARECGHHSVSLLNSKTSSLIHVLHVCNLSQTRIMPMFASRFA